MLRTFLEALGRCLAMLNSSKLDEPVGAGASRRPKTAGKKRRNLFGGVYSQNRFRHAFMISLHGASVFELGS